MGAGAAPPGFLRRYIRKRKKPASSVIDSETGFLPIKYFYLLRLPRYFSSQYLQR